ncbi:hypothetical protein ESOMN_v1c03860 [Williamsoniiplasma somnilux]|uniref:Uncharacterized protein n=1 Tax=Williamsoniiplasma somnilux TaxID=215578 RepID=A0A2K8NZY2_9MOLU|nr:hypothetical protein [Williamsoniiplasma somnilux]ATZ18768.1 hypothetical protein ESOMN_v1c03860 [Williamsoniiplasma somnilux]
MKKILFIFIVIFSFLGGGIIYFYNQELGLSNKEITNYYCAIRYNLPTEIKINFPKILFKDSNVPLKEQFVSNNSNIDFFEPIIFEKNYVILDIKTKYVQKINYKLLTINFLKQTLRVSEQICSDLIAIFKTGLNKEIRKREVINYCSKINQSIIYEKGMKKFIIF